MRILNLFLLLAIMLPAAGPAKTVRLTIYDDGISCPGNCDADVVFHKTLNGTEFAHAPSTPAAPYSKCPEPAACFRIALSHPNLTAST